MLDLPCRQEPEATEHIGVLHLAEMEMPGGDLVSAQEAGEVRTHPVAEILMAAGLQAGGEEEKLRALQPRPDVRGRGKPHVVSLGPAKHLQSGLEACALLRRPLHLVMNFIQGDGHIIKWNVQADDRRDNSRPQTVALAQCLVGGNQGGQMCAGGKTHEGHSIRTSPILTSIDRQPFDRFGHIVRHFGQGGEWSA